MSNIGFGEITLERVLNQANLKEAYKTVVSNKGAPGVDGMRVDDLLEHIRNHPYELTQSIRDGIYYRKSNGVPTMDKHGSTLVNTNRPLRNRTMGGVRGLNKLYSIAVT